MNFRPIDDRLLIELIEENEKVGSLVIPEAAKEKPVSGIVLSIGNDWETVGRIPIDRLIAVGDTILFGKYAGQEVKIDGKKCMVISRQDILGVMEK